MTDYTFNADERIGVYIDGANLHYTAKALFGGCDVDFRKLKEWFRARGRLMRMNYYTMISEQAEYVSLRPLVDWLQYNGYTVHTKAGREVFDSAGIRRWRGDIDVDLAVDAVRSCRHLDHLVLISGDGDFLPMIKAVKQEGVRVSVISTIKTSPVLVADELRRNADQFVDLADIADEVFRSHDEVAARRAARG